MDVVVLDTGSYETRGGYANPEREPPVITPTAVRVRARTNGGATQPAAEAPVHHPVQRRTVKSWDEVEAIWNYVLYDQLAWVAGEEGSVLIAEPLFNSREAREQTTQIMFETFNVSGLYLAEQPLLSMYATGRLTGTVVDVGEGCVDIAPVVEGQLVAAGLRRVNYGGGDMTLSLQSLLAARLGDSGAMDLATAGRLRETTGAVAPSREAFESGTGVGPSTHTLPDGRTITLTGGERCRPAEALFDPGLSGGSAGAGLPQEVLAAVLACGAESRRQLLDGVAVCGGGAAVPGLESRLLGDLAALCPPAHKPAAVRPPEYMPDSTLRYAAWLGGSILAKVVFPQNQQINKFDYDETGPCVCHKKNS